MIKINYVQISHKKTQKNFTFKMFGRLIQTRLLKSFYTSKHYQHIAEENSLKNKHSEESCEFFMLYIVIIMSYNEF